MSSPTSLLTFSSIFSSSLSFLPFSPLLCRPLLTSHLSLHISVGLSPGRGHSLLSSAPCVSALIPSTLLRAVPVADAIQEIDATRFYSNHPKNLVTFSDGEREWFFFIHEDDESCSSRAQRKRTVREVGNGLGFWKPNGSENPIYNEDGNVFATKIYLTYFSGSCHSNKPKRTHWKMVEYHLQIRREWVVLGRLQRGMDYTGF